MKKTFTILTVLLAVVIMNTNVIAQKDGDLITNGIFRTLRSKIMNEERKLLISLPPGYERSNKEYPVIYITDGSEYTFQRSAGLIRYSSHKDYPY